MPLRVLDGNQTATTLSSVVTEGEHIVAHSVVCLGSTAIANITNAVSGSVVTIPSLARIVNSAATDGIADGTLNFIKIGGHQSGSNQTAHIVHVSAGGSMSVDASGSSVTFTQASVTFGAITGSASILNFPSTQTIAGTVTANVFGSDDALGIPAPFPIAQGGDSFTSGARLGVAIINDNAEELGLQGGIPLNVSGTVTVGNSVTIGSLPAISGTVTARLQDASGNNLTSTSIGGVQRLNVSLASAATPGGSIPTFVNVYGGSDSGTVRVVAVDSSGRSVVTVSNFPATQAVSLASTTVTVSALPSGALTTRFGSVVTANLAFITSAVTNTSRKYLLAQNISAGTVTIGIGFSPTTTQGIQLTAGAGLTFDAFCPTGAVYWLGAVTGAAFTILEG